MLLAALAVAAFTPAHAGPASARASISQFVNGNVTRQIVIGTNVLAYENWFINVYTNKTYKADNLPAAPTETDTYTASVQYNGCTNNFSNCTNYNAYSNSLPSTILQMDPVGNSATVQMTLVDDFMQPHTFSLTLSRPQQSYLYNSMPNAWVDGISAGAGAPNLAFSRTGYTINGSIDNGALVNTTPGPCSGTCGQTWGSASQQLDYATATVGS
jgi:hypothetical protein